MGRPRRPVHVRRTGRAIGLHTAGDERRQGLEIERLGQEAGRPDLFGVQGRHRARLGGGDDDRGVRPRELTIARGELPAVHSRRPEVEQDQGEVTSSGSPGPLDDPQGRRSIGSGEYAVAFGQERVGHGISSRSIVVHDQHARFTLHPFPPCTLGSRPIRKPGET